MKPRKTQWNFRSIASFVVWHAAEAEAKDRQTDRRTEEHSEKGRRYERVAERSKSERTSRGEGHTKKE